MFDIGGFFVTCIEMERTLKDLQRAIVYKRVKQSDLARVDALMELWDKRSKGGKVQSKEDWIFVKYLWRFLKENQPGAFEAWQKEMEIDRQSYRMAGGYRKHRVKEENSGHFIQHTLTVPEVFFTQMRKFYPNQDIANKDFIKGFIEIVPEARLTDNHHRI